MDDAGDKLLAFINTVRGLQDRDHIRYLIYLDADPDDPENCILSRAMHCWVGPSSDPEWEAAGRWVMRCDDRLTAYRTKVCCEQDWIEERLEVELPELLIDFITAAHFGLVEPDDIGFVRCWHVPRDPHDPAKGFERHFMPGMRESVTGWSAELSAT